MDDRRATDAEIEQWRTDGWVLLESLVDPDTVDAVHAELAGVLPTAAEYHADPDAARERWLGRPPAARTGWEWPPDGPGFRPEQHRWKSEFPVPDAPRLNRLCVHPAIVDAAARALGSDDLRLYQAQVGAKYTGECNYEQPMHTDRNHSWVPLSMRPPWAHVETFLYLSDVDAGHAPTHLVAVGDSVGREQTVPLVMPDQDPELYAAARPAAGVRGSLLLYRSDVFHRAVDLTAPGGARYLLNLSFRRAGHDWIGFHAWQGKATSPDWVTFVEGSSPRDLALLGFPPPGHPIWDAALLHDTARRYPRLDLSAWQAALPPPPQGS
jgi:hypothetical protein